MASRTLSALVLLLAPAGASAQQPAPSSAQGPAQGPATSAPAVATAAGYQLGVGDEVQVTLFGQPDMTVRTRVRDDGTIAYPLLGSVPVSGRSTRQVAATIGGRLKSGGYYANPVVGVDVTAYVSNAFTLFGSLATPGIYPLDRPTTIAMAIARGGGARAEAADFALLRRPGAAQEQRIDFADLSATGGINMPLRPGDTLVVPGAPLVYVYGQVGAPGSYPVKGRMTLRQALILAGGLTLAGNEKRVTLRRNGATVKRADLDEEVRGDDVLFVNERFF